MIAGTHSATRGDLALVELPQRTATYMPVPYLDLLKIVEQELGGMGWSVVEEDLVLTRKGMHMFAVWKIRPTGMVGMEGEIGKCMGIRSSYNMDLSNGITFGQYVFVCSNLAFHGEILIFRKHTIHVIEDIRVRLREGLLKGIQGVDHLIQWTEGLRAVAAGKWLVSRLLVESVVKGAISSSQMKKVYDEFTNPKHPEFGRDLYGLHNAYTEVLKETPITLLPERTQTLNKVFVSVLEEKKILVENK